MSIKKGLLRITIDILKEDHTKLKAMAALLGKSIHEIVIESIEERLYSSKIPNKRALKVIAEVQAGKGLVTAKDAEDLFKKLAFKC